MSIPTTLLDIQAYTGEGYQPLVDYQSWRVAILRYNDEQRVENLDNMQRHNETDEVFVLLSGHCILFIGAGQNDVGEIYAEDMEPLYLYNVKRGAWHAHALSPDATVLIIENRDTTYDNSPRTPLDSSQRATVGNLARQLWK